MTDDTMTNPAEPSDEEDSEFSDDKQRVRELFARLKARVAEKQAAADSVAPQPPADLAEEDEP
jgi:hypothetical protein